MRTNNPNVIGLYKQLGEAIEADRQGYLAIATISNNGRVGFGFGGEVWFEDEMIKVLDQLKAQLQIRSGASAYPERDDTLGPDYICYNVLRGVLSFDFIPWLINAEMIRVVRKAAAPLKVGFWCGNDPAQMKMDDRRHWLDNIFRPALSLIGAVEDETAVRGYHHKAYAPRLMSEMSRAGNPVPVLHTDRECKHGSGYVTITLREAGYSLPRNSNVSAWLSFATDLERQGERVIIVRDTAKADEKLPGFITAPDASRDLLARMALYQNAKANLFVSNGPCSLAINSRRPYLVFTAMVDIDTPELFKRSLGMEVGEQYPWALPDQRIIYKPDTYENIVEAWVALNVNGRLARAA